MKSSLPLHGNFQLCCTVAVFVRNYTWGSVGREIYCRSLLASKDDTVAVPLTSRGVGMAVRVGSTPYQAFGQIGLGKQCRLRSDCSESSLIRVFTVCHSVCIFWTHYSMIKPHCSNFRIITAIFRVSEYFGILRYFRSWGCRFEPHRRQDSFQPKRVLHYTESS